MSNYDQENNFAKFLLKKIKTIMIPFWSFSLLAIVVEMLYRNLGASQILDLFTLLLKGNIRNTFISAGLWFLSCLFVMEIIFKLIKYLNSKWFVFFICFIAFVFSAMIATLSFVIFPRWIYNIDSALYYIIFYAIGYITYPYLLNLFKLDTSKKKLLFGIIGIISFIYAGLIFFGKEIFFILLNGIPLLLGFVPLLQSLMLILFNLIIAKIIENITIFREIGKNTLFLCGNEYITTTLVMCLFGLLGFIPTPANALSAYIYTSILLLIGMKFVIPLEKYIVSSVKNVFK